ncbi:hypothetical protein ACFRKA_31680, partial [Streptomyces sp. NPDC056660]
CARAAHVPHGVMLCAGIVDHLTLCSGLLGASGRSQLLTSTASTIHPSAARGSSEHPRLTAHGPWLDHCGELLPIHGTLIRLKAEHLPGDRDPKPVRYGPHAPA